MKAVKYPCQMSIDELVKAGLSRENAKQYKKIVREHRKAKVLFESLERERTILEAKIKIEYVRNEREQSLHELMEKFYEKYPNLK